MRALNVSNRAQNDIVVLAEECKINNSINHTLFVRQKKTTVDNNESLQVIVEIYVELATLAPFHLSSLLCVKVSVFLPFFLPYSLSFSSKSFLLLLRQCFFDQSRL